MDRIEVNVQTGEQTVVPLSEEEIAGIEAYSPPPPNVRQEILTVSQAALASGFLHVMMFDMMSRYLKEAQAIVPEVTESDLINPESPYYSHAYAETKLFYDQLKALQDQK